MKRWFPALICLLHLIILIFLALKHPFGTFATETDFYHFYAPDAERLAAAGFPENTYQGPGYPAVLALIAKVTGADLFSAGKWLSVICAVLCGWLVYRLFAQLFGFWVGIGAQLIAVASGEFPQFSINAATDVFFLAICLAALVIFTDSSFTTQRRVLFSAELTGLAYLTRYNGLFLLATFLIGILLINVFEQSWRVRLKLSAVFLVLFLVVASPWFYANYRRHGSPLYNTNYLNIATEFYPELVAGKTNQDGTRALEEKFKSFGDVLRYDPGRLLSSYPVNLWQSLRFTFTETLVNWWVAALAWIGAALVLFTQRSKAVLVVLLAGALYLLLMGLNHWESRYYFFVMTLYAGLAVFAVWQMAELARARGWLQHRAFILAPIALVAALFVLSVRESQRDVRRFLAGHPWEIIAARDYLNSVNPPGERLRIVARKPHLAYLARGEWVFFPPVKSLDELRAWVEANHVDYIAIGKRELKERRELTPLGHPENAPSWLKPVWINDEPMFILYQPQATAK